MKRYFLYVGGGMECKIADAHRTEKILRRYHVDVHEVRELEFNEWLAARATESVDETT